MYMYILPFYIAFLQPVGLSHHWVASRSYVMSVFLRFCHISFQAHCIATHVCLQPINWTLNLKLFNHQMSYHEAYNCAGQIGAYCPFCMHVYIYILFTFMSGFIVACISLHKLQSLRCVLYYSHIMCGLQSVVYTIANKPMQIWKMLIAKF